MSAGDGRRRVVIEGVQPEIDGGRFPIKRVVGETVVVEADVFTDGHDSLSARLLYRPENEPDWSEVALTELGNDHWRGEFSVSRLGTYLYTVLGWVDRFLTWRRDFRKRVAAGQDVAVDLLIGAELIEAAAAPSADVDRDHLIEWSRRLRTAQTPEHLQRICEDADLTWLMDQYSDRSLASMYERELKVTVDREAARFSSWYELFPRSTAPEPGRHGTLRDCAARVPYVAAMGFDVLYLPPIHPIGRAHRKGPNNVPTAGPGDHGSPWAIGADEGGHKAIHPELGTFEDFAHLVQTSQDHGLALALDIAFQCAPDHPYVKEHPQWFRSRPDGTIQYAENPPKKYQDIYPFDFETDDWQALWEELKSIFVFWIERGVRVFRVDNPHTKPFAFWEWAIGEIKRDYPDVIFLSEAFTRPKIMYRLAKLGFTQSYTYFAWRNTKQELTEYLTELTTTEVAEFFRPNFWPNTPDILTEHLQMGGRPVFLSRLVLAATLTANYGIYGPVFEHCVNRPREPGSEEYLHSEKYEVWHHDLNRPDSLKDLIARVNRIRRENPALQSDGTLQFHRVDNDELICYSKHNEDLSDIILVVVCLDPHHTQSGWVELPLEAFDLNLDRPYQLHDLLSDARYLWHGSRNYVELNPHVVPAHIFRIRRPVRTERDFEYYM
jgi:starch synthase (maltosyl-transferring)